MEATNREISCKHESVPPKCLEPLLLEGNHMTKIIPQECHHPIAAKRTSQTVYDRETSKKTRTDYQDQVVQKLPSSSPEHIGPPSKNSITWNNQKYPQEQIGALKRLSGMDMADKPAKANIKSVGLRTFLKLKISGKEPAAPEGEYNLWEENPTRQPTPRRAVLASARQNIQTLWKTCQTWKYMHKFMAPN